MKGGDIVRVIRQPPGMYVKILNEVGFVEKTLGYLVSVQTISENGETRGAGSVPQHCLEVIDEPIWNNAKKLHDERIDKLHDELMAHDKRYKKLVKKVAAKYGVTPKVARAIHDELCE